MNKILYIGNKLSKHGINLTTIETLTPLLQSGGLSVVSVSDKKNFILRIFDMGLSVLKHKNSDYVLIDSYSTLSFYYLLLVSQLCRLLNLKYIPILHGGNLPERLKQSTFLSKLIFKNAFINVAPSNYLFVKFHEAGFQNVAYIPNFVHIEQYPFKKRNTFQPKLLWVRAFAEIYNPKMAVSVLQKLKEKHPSAQLTMVGPDKDGTFSEVEKLARDLNLSVNFTGKLTKSEWICLAKEHDVFINTTHIDNMPVSLLEAMALGLPIVSTKVGGIPYLIENNKNGFLVTDADVAMMVKTIENILIDTVTTQSVVNEARMLVEAMDAEIIQQKWLKLLA